MNIWQFLDKQISRLSPSGTAGAGIFILTGIVLYMVYHDRTLSESDLFKTLAQAIVVQGLVGLAMAAWFTKKADERPQDVKVTNEPSEPVPSSAAARLAERAPAVQIARAPAVKPAPNVAMPNAVRAHELPIARASPDWTAAVHASASTSKWNIGLNWLTAMRPPVQPPPKSE